MSERDIDTGKRVLVMGLGLHGGGVSVVRWLLKHGARVTITDLKTKKQLATSVRRFQISNFKSQIRFVLGKHREEDFRNADIVVQNPAVPRESPYLAIARKAGAEIENEATLFFTHCQSKNIIGVTGTRGKSTTAAMIAHILNLKSQISNLKSRVWLAGNIRTTPMLSIVDRVRPDDWVALELSSWHLENLGEQKISPHVAVVTNLLEDHMNRYRSMAAYSAAKENIVRYQTKDDVAILNKANKWTRAMEKRTKAKVIWYTKPKFEIQNLKFFGEHNDMNAQAAAAVCRAVGVPVTVIRAALKTFRGLPDRQEIVRVVRGVTYVNDTTATTPDATIAALQRFKKNIILICGGTDKNLHYQSLIPWIKKTCKAIVLLPGSATEKIKRLLVTRYLLPVTEVQSMHEAVADAQPFARRGDIILLSPAAASFGLFQHEFDRGEQFKKLVAAAIETKKLKN